MYGACAKPTKITTYVRIPHRRTSKIVAEGKKEGERILERLANPQKLTLQTNELVLPSKDVSGLFRGKVPDVGAGREFQLIERQKTLDGFEPHGKLPLAAKEKAQWLNRLVYGDNLLVMQALLAGAVMQALLAGDPATGLPSMRQDTMEAIMSGREDMGTSCKSWLNPPSSGPIFDFALIRTREPGLPSSPSCSRAATITTRASAPNATEPVTLSIGERPSMAIGLMLRPRWLPEKSFPPYAYLPGRQPHPVRDPAGHSYHVEPMPVAAEASLGSDVFLWGLDLFNHGYYWEAHEAWEGLWQVVDRGGPSRMLFKGLILLSAAGVKIREGKHAAAVRHAGRAASLLRRLMKVPELAFERALGMSPAALAEYAETAAKTHAALQATAPGQPQPVFNFILGSNSHGRPSGQVSRRLL